MADRHHWVDPNSVSTLGETKIRKEHIASLKSYRSNETRSGDYVRLT